MNNNFSLGIGGRFQQGALLNYTEEYKAVLSSITGIAPDNYIKRSQDNFIKYLKGSNPIGRNVWSKLVCLIVPMAKMPDANDAIMWWTNPERKGTLSTTPPSYVLGSGLKGNGIDAYFGTGFNPFIDGGAKYTQNDCSMIALFTNHRDASDYSGSGLANLADESGLSLQPKTALSGGDFGVIIRSQAQTYNSNTSKKFSVIKGFYAISRYSEFLASLYVDAAKVLDDNTQSYPLQDLEAYGLKINNRNTYYSSDTIGLIGFGSSLDQTDINVLNEAVANLDYALNAVGNYPFVSDYEKINIQITDYNGGDIFVHPAVLNIGEQWNGHQYWMAITPYPSGNDDFENPCIYASNDGIVWVVPNGLTNPIEP